MVVSRAARAVLGINALVVAVGVVVQLFVAHGSTEGFFSGTAAVLNVFAYFTVQSNLILGVTCLVLAIDVIPQATWFRACG